MSERELITRTSSVTRTQSLHRSTPEHRPFFRPPVQAKLSVSQPDDPHERQADRVAEQVTAKLNAPHTSFRSAQVMRASEPEEDREAEVSRQVAPEPEREKEEIAPRIQRLARPAGAPAIARSRRACAPPPVRSARTRVSRSAEVQGLPRGRGPPSPGRGFQRQLTQSQGSGQPMAPSIRGPMEHAFGTDFSSVRIHQDSRAIALNRSIDAQAFTYRNHVYFDRGRYQPDQPSGQKLLAHELTHVVQQGGDVRRAVRKPRLGGQTSLSRGPPVSRSARPDRAPGISSSPPKVQRLLGSIRRRLAGWVHEIPGYTLFTVVIGYDPVRGKNVPWTAHNLLDGAFRLVPVIGKMVFGRLVEYGVVQSAGEIVQRAIKRLGLGISRITSLIERAWDRMDFIRTNPIAHNKRILIDTFQSLVDEVVRTVKNVLSDLLELVKTVLLKTLRGMSREFGGDAYELLTLVLGKDPITDEHVDTSTEMVIERFLLLIGRKRELEKMREHGTVGKVATWIDQQLAMLKAAFSTVPALFVAAWSSFSLEDLWHPIAALRRVGKIFGPFVGQVGQFAYNVASQVIAFIKEVLLGMARRYARKIYGYPLLTVLLKRDPITGEYVPRTAKNFIRGFLSLIPGGREKYAQLEESGAIDRTFAWLEEQIETLNIGWTVIRDTFVQAWSSVGIEDIMHPIEAFERIVGIFAPLIRRIIAFGKAVFLKVLEFVFEAVMGAAGTRVLEALKRGADTFMLIIRNPVGFLGNLLAAVKGGFQNFADHIWDHLREGLVQWLFGTLGEAGIQMPSQFDLQGILSIVLQILGISYQRIRVKLVDRLGEQTVARLESTFDLLRTLMIEGPVAAWRQLLGYLGNIRDTIMEKIRDWVATRIVTAAITKLATMFNPVGAVINAILTIYNTVQFFIERINQIAQVVAAIIESVNNIAIGALGPAMEYVEKTLAGTIPLVISFLARLLGLGGITDKIREIIGTIHARVDAALERLVDWIVRMGGRVAAAGKAVAGKVLGWAGLRRSFKTQDGESHAVFFEESGGRHRLMIASTPQAARHFLNQIKQGGELSKRKQKHYDNAEALVGKLEKAAAKLDAAGDQAPQALRDEVMDLSVHLANSLRLLLGRDHSFAEQREKYRLEGMVATYSTMPQMTDDQLTPDHQPQAAVLKWCAQQRYFRGQNAGSREMQKRAGGDHANGGYAINLHEIRHMEGATYGSKGTGTLNDFINVAKPAAAGKRTAAEKRAAVIPHIRGALNRDADAMLVVIRKRISHANWKDINDLDFGAGKKASDQKKQLRKEIRERIEAGESRIRGQSLDSLR